MGRLKTLGLERGSTPSSVVEVNLPASKSISNRALIIQHLSAEEIRIENLSVAEDTVLLKQALRKGSGELWMGDAGTAARFSMAWAAVTEGERILTGSERLSKRPMKPLIDALRKLGARITCLDKEGFLPVKIEGQKLKGGQVEIAAHESSQFISALMLIAPQLPKGLLIKFLGVPTSLPYLNMTKTTMVTCGAEVIMKETSIEVLSKEYSQAELVVEADWSAASYFFSAVALHSHLKLSLAGLNSRSIQGDSILTELYRPLGVAATFDENGIRLENMGHCSPLPEINLIDCPDLAQTIAVTYAGLKFSVTLTGLHTLRVKETDRLTAMANELKKIGVDAEAGDDVLFVKAGNQLVADQIISTYGDHRMAMAFAPLVFKTSLILENPVVVAKSFPHFFDEFLKLGVRKYT